MAELGKLLIGLGAVIVVAGIVLMLLGRMNFLGAAAGRLFVSWKEHDGVFSSGYVGGGERGAFGFVVCAEPVAAMTESDFPLLTRGVALCVTAKCHPASSWLYAPESPTVLRT